MSANTWVDTVLRFARNRADRLWDTHLHQRLSAPDYDIPAFIRRGISIPALEAFHAPEATADRCGSARSHPHREEC